MTQSQIINEIIPYLFNVLHYPLDVLTNLYSATYTTGIIIASIVLFLSVKYLLHPLIGHAGSDGARLVNSNSNHTNYRYRSGHNKNYRSRSDHNKNYRSRSDHNKNNYRSKSK